jgi:uncharacterized protein (TIGR02466 family)
MEHTIYPLFSHPVFSTKVNVDNKKIINILKKFKYVPNETVNKEESNCFHTESTKVLNKLPELKNEIIKKVNYYLNDIMHYTVNFKLINSWGTKTLKNGFSQTHSHCNSFLSGVYYPEAIYNTSISFISSENEFWKIKQKEYNIFNAKAWKFTLEKNLLLLFFSKTKHKIDLNSSDNERYSIAFNVNPVGKIGSFDAEVEFK